MDWSLIDLMQIVWDADKPGAHAEVCCDETTEWLAERSAFWRSNKWPQSQEIADMCETAILLHGM